MYCVYAKKIWRLLCGQKNQASNISPHTHHDPLTTDLRILLVKKLWSLFKLFTWLVTLTPILQKEMLHGLIILHDIWKKQNVSDMFTNRSFHIFKTLKYLLQYLERGDYFASDNLFWMDRHRFINIRRKSVQNGSAENIKLSVCQLPIKK